MRFILSIALSVGLLLFVAGSLQAEGYLTKDGRLTQTLKVKQLQGGFAGFTGIEYTVAEDGAWTSARIFNRRVTPLAKGKLSAEELAKLAAILEKNALIKLPAKSGKAPGANPHSITFQYGKQQASLVGRVPPKPDAKDPAGTVESRFAGIWQEVKDLLKAPVKEKK